MPATVETIRAFMAEVDFLAEQEKAIRATITTLSEEFELLIEAIYNEPPDEQMLAIIQTKRMSAYTGENGSLF